MAENNDVRQDYEEKLQVILRTCLMCNKSEELGKAVGYTLHGNGNKGFKGKPLVQLDRIYGWLCAKASDMTDKFVDLDDLLADYKKVSECWMRLRRTYSCDLHKPNEEHFQRNKSLLFALLDYTLDKEAAIKKYASLFATDRYIQMAEDFERYSRDIALFRPLILLLMTGLLPKYDSKQTKVDNLDDLDLLHVFLREYLQQSVAVKYLRDDLVANLCDDADEKISCDKYPVCRLLLIVTTKFCFELLKIYTEGGDILKFLKSYNSYEKYEIEGYWTNSEGVNTNFWKIERKGANFYFLTYYERKPDRHGSYKLEKTGFICSIDEYLRVYDLEVYESHVRKNGPIVSEEARFDVNFQCVDIGKGKRRIDKIVLSPVYESVAWFPYRVFYRVPEIDEDNNDYKENKDTISEEKYAKKNVKLYEEMINKLPLVNKNCKHFMFVKLTCIVPDFLYIPIDESDLMRIHATDNESHRKYLKVPKKLNPNFQNINIDSPFFMVTFEDETTFVGSFAHRLFYEITTPEQRKKHGIELVDKIEDY